MFPRHSHHACYSATSFPQQLGTNTSCRPSRLASLVQSLRRHRLLWAQSDSLNSVRKLLVMDIRAISQALLSVLRICVSFCHFHGYRVFLNECHELCTLSPAGTPANTSKVLEYLSKKGYVRTEAMLRKESEPQANGQSLVPHSTEVGGIKYTKAFELIRKYTEDNLDLYKPELRKLLWPMFVYSFLDLVREYFSKDAETFFATYQGLFERDHEEDVKTMRQVRLPTHIKESRIAKLYTENKYRVTLTTMPFYNLVQFLESKMFEGGQALLDIIREHMNIVTVDRTATAEKSIAAILASEQGDDDLPAEDEGIPGHNPGHPLTTRHDPEADAARIRLTLGVYPQDQDLQDDVRAALQEEDAKNAPRPGQPTLVEEYEQRIKREPTEDGPSRDTIPLPPSLARDVSMEVSKIQEYRDRYKMEGRTGGVGPAVSVTMYTFHNTFDR